MSLPVDLILQRLISSYVWGKPLVLLFDYDGTLVPIAEHPRLAQLDRGTRRVLAELARLPRVHLGIVSGRMLDEVKEMMCLPQACFAGTCGLELDFHGVRLRHPRARGAVRLLTSLVPQLQSELNAFPGAWLEDKRLGLTVHYRNVPPHLAAGLCCRVRKVLESCETELRITNGPMAIEIAPELGWSKGTAVQLLLRHLGADGTGTVYAGDSDNDTEALEVVEALGGIAIGVGPQAPPTAKYRVPCPAALVDFLRGMKDALLSNSVVARQAAQIQRGNLDRHRSLDYRP